MSRVFPTWTAVQSSLEFVGIGIGAFLSTLEGAETGGYFLMGVHVIFIIHVCLGLLFYYTTYTARIAYELQFVFAGMFFFCLAAMGIYFYFIVKISDPNVFDILLNKLGILTFIVMLFYIAKMVCYTYFAYDIYASMRWGPGEDAVVPTDAPAKPAQPKVPLYLLDYEKMCGKSSR